MTVLTDSVDHGLGCISSMWKLFYQWTRENSVSRKTADCVQDINICETFTSRNKKKRNAIVAFSTMEISQSWNPLGYYPSIDWNSGDSDSSANWITSTLLLLVSSILLCIKQLSPMNFYLSCILHVSETWAHRLPWSVMTPQHVLNARIGVTLTHHRPFWTLIRETKLKRGVGVVLVHLFVRRPSIPKDLAASFGHIHHGDYRKEKEGQWCWVPRRTMISLRKVDTSRVHDSPLKII